MSDNVMFLAAQVANLVGGELQGAPETEIFGLNRIEEVKEGELTFYTDKKFSRYLKDIKASCLIVPLDFDEEISDKICLIKVEKPYHSIVKLLKFLESLLPKPSSFIHPTAIIDETASISSTAYIGPYCVIGKNCKIGENVILHSNVCLYDDVEIGDNCLLHSGIVCCSETKIGKNCIIQAGVVIGSDGFGYLENKDGSYEKIPQLGNVIIEDNVEIGANTAIDRALIGSTVIGRGVKIDNLCQIGHNVRIGENSAMAGQAGLAGSCTVGKRNRLGGQVGLAGHLETADDVVVLAQSGVARSIEKKGIYFGSPSKERLHAFKVEAALNNLPDLVKKIEQLNRKLEEYINKQVD